MNEAIDMA